MPTTHLAADPVGKPVIVPGEGKKRARDERLDFVRGLTMLLMFPEHLSFNLLAAVSPAAVCLSSCSEIFIYVSGYISGLVFGRSLEQRGFRACAAHVWRRCLTLYATNVAWLLGCFAALWFAGCAYLLHPPTTDIILSAITMRWVPGLYQVLTVYIVLLAFLPVVLLSMRRWPHSVLTASATLYAITLLFPDRTDVLSRTVSTEWVGVCSWQLLFYFGSYMGMRKLGGAPGWRAPRWLVTSSMIFLIAASAWKLLRFVLRTDLFGVAGALGLASITLPLPDKYHLSPVRLISFAATAVVFWPMVANVMSRLPALIRELIGDCGRKALPVFSLHTVLITLAVAAGLNDHPALRTVAAAGGIVLLIAFAHLLVHRGIPKRLPVFTRQTSSNY